MDLSGVDCVSEVDGKAQGEQKAVAADAFEEVGADHVEEDAGTAHAGAPSRCCDRQKR